MSYLEGRLAPREKALVEDHLNRCPRCTAEVEELGGLVHALKENKRAFCPAPSVLFEAAKSPAKRPLDLDQHLSQCALCREEFDGYRREAREAIPRELWSRIQERVPHQSRGAEASHKGREEEDGLWQRLMRWPAFAAAASAAVAVVLLVVVLFPRDQENLTIGLSSTSWQTSPRPKSAMGQDRRQVALVILFKNFPKTMPQSEIDRLYQALAPTMELSERYRIISPGDLSRALAGLGKAQVQKKEIVASLKKNLDVSTAVLITISPSGKGFAVEADLVDAGRGSSVRRRTADGVTRSDLSTRLRQEADAVLLH